MSVRAIGLKSRIARRSQSKARSYSPSVAYAVIKGAGLGLELDSMSAIAFRASSVLPEAASIPAANGLQPGSAEAKYPLSVASACSSSPNAR